MTVAATFTIHYSQFIDEGGNPIGDLPPIAQNPDKLISLYKAMVQLRTFDTKAVALQRTGRLGTYPPCLGQEATSIGFASAMQERDVLVPSYREQGAQFWRGLPLENILLYWGGDERGNVFPSGMRDFPSAVPVASQNSHATGMAHAFKLRGEPQAVVCALGDGATSKGDFYEAMNMAGIWKLPVVFLVTNNHWAISVSRDAQTAAQTLAQKAIAAGIPGEQVDGNDVTAVHHVMDQALKKARAGGGAHVVEALTYRMGDHTTADDATRYRNPDLVGQHWKKDPIVRLRTYLSNQGWWKKEDEELLHTQAAQIVETSVNNYLAIPAPDESKIFDYLFETLPEPLQSQREGYLARLEILHNERKTAHG